LLLASARQASPLWNTQKSGGTQGIGGR
jgi:hypothetical protein